MSYSRITRILTACLVAGAALVGPAAEASPTVEPEPNLTPREVVEAQLDALQHNDVPAEDDGMRTAYRFASPRNQETTGPIDRFIRMLRAPAYAPLLNHRVRSLSETTEVNDMARIKVTLVDSNGEQAAYVWILSRQPDPPCQGCWMTDTVLRVEVRNSPFQTAMAGEALR